MSGSGSSGYTPMPSSGFNCINGIFLTNLVSIDYELLKKYSVNDLLDINILEGAVVVENNDGEILGSVLHANIEDLKQCIAEGNVYKAEIIKIQSSACQVKISRK